MLTSDSDYEKQKNNKNKQTRMNQLPCKVYVLTNEV